MPLEIGETVEEAAAGIDVAVERRDERLARPGASPTPRRVEREIVEQRRDRPGRIVGARQRYAARYRAVPRRDRGVEQAGPQRLGVARGGGGLQLGREGEQGGKGADQRVRVVPGLQRDGR
jgi:hypothetical protein